MGFEPTTFAFQASALPTELPGQLSWQGLNHTTQSNQSSKAIHNLFSLSSDKQADSNSACTCVAHCDKGFTDDDSFCTQVPVRNTVLSRMGPRLDLNVGVVNGLTPSS